MKRALIAAAMAAASIAAHAEFWSGNTLLDNLKSSNPYLEGAGTGYVTGALDALTNVTVCPPKTATVGQVSDIMKQYLEANPADRHNSADRIINHVFKAAWPCAKAQKGGSV